MHWRRVAGCGRVRRAGTRHSLELFVIAATAGGVDEAAGDPGDEQLVLDHELYDGVELLLALFEHLVEHGRLRHGAGEAVEHEPATGGRTRVCSAMNQVRGA